jgi:phosphohistidine phosphatase SixA
VAAQIVSDRNAIEHQAEVITDHSRSSNALGFSQAWVIAGNLNGHGKPGLVLCSDGT